MGGRREKTLEAGRRGGKGLENGAGVWLENSSPDELNPVHQIERNDNQLSGSGSSANKETNLT